MRIRKRGFKIVATALIAVSLWILPDRSAAQDLVNFGSITGGASVFVFRQATRAVKRFVQAVKPKRTKAQRLDTAKKVRSQYETIAKVKPKAGRAQAVDPLRMPKNARTLPAAEGSKLFAGVGEFYNQKGEFEQAIPFFLDAVGLDDKNIAAKNGLSDAYAMKGNDLLVKDQAATAKGLFLEALKYDSTNSAAYFGLAEVYSELDQYDEAIANYEKSLAANKDLTEIYVPLGILYYQNGDIAKADAMLTKALASSATSAETQFFLGLVRSSQGRNDEAAAAFQQAKTLDAKMEEAFFQSGEVLSRLKRHTEAIADYERAVALRPAYFEAWLGLADAYYEVKNYPKALEAYKQATRLKNDNWEAYLGLAESYRFTEDFNQAKANYDNAGMFLKRQKDFNKETAADIYSKIGYVVGRQCEINTRNFVACNWGAAVRALEEAVKLGGNPLDNANLGWAYYNWARNDIDSRLFDAAKPKLESAKTNLQTALASADAATADGVRQNLGAVLIDLGDFTGAIEALKPVVQNRPEWTFSRYALGTAYFKANDFENAAKTFRAGIDKDPDNASLLTSLGQSELKRKNGKEVKRIIEKLKSLNQVPQALQLERDAKIAKVI
jgi:tetratricopeptide (TPR) repeat protein